MSEQASLPFAAEETISTVELRASRRLANHVQQCVECESLSFLNGRLCPDGKRLATSPQGRPERVSA